MKRSGPPARRTPLRASSAGMKRSPMKRTHASSTDFTEAVKARVRRRSMDRCEAQTPNCRRGGTLHFHHRKLRSSGGQGTFDNCLHVCTTCHDYIHAHPLEAVDRGWIIPSWENTAG